MGSAIVAEHVAGLDVGHVMVAYGTPDRTVFWIVVVVFILHV